METLVKYNSFLEAGNIEFESFDNDDPEHRTSINNLLQTWEKNSYNFDFNIIGNVDLKSPLFGFIKSCVYTDTKIKKYEKELKGYILEVDYFYNQNRELNEYIKKKMEDLSVEFKNINKKLEDVEVYQQRINQYLLTRIYVIFAILFFMFAVIIMK
jgi:hypothetical protein